MDPLQFFAACRLVIVAGKGGVGKTTVTAAMAVAAARHGRRVLVVEMEGASGLGPLLGSTVPLTTEDSLLRVQATDGRGAILGRVVSPGDALTDYLTEHGMRRLSGRLARTGVIDVVATAAPGLDDILVLGKVKQLERVGDYDLILLDAPAAGHAVTFLRSAKGLADAVTVGPIAVQAKEVLELLADGHRCQVVLVTLPEETPVNELVETAYSLEDEVGISLGPVVVNGTYADIAGIDADPEAAAAEAGAALREGEARALADAADFRRHRTALQTEQIDRLAELLPLPQLSLPYLFDADLGPREVDVLAHRLLAGIGGLTELANPA
jgi:anion-transporting  ArsA/GET3 family ATPase